MRRVSARMTALGTVSCLGLLAIPALAQEDIPDQDAFLGTVELGQSKRDIDTTTALAETTIGQAELNDRQAGTIAHLVDTVPGVTLVNGNTPQGSGINIRGFGANGSYGTDQKVKVMVDGATTGAEELYRIGTQLYTDPELYRSVDVLRGTMGSFEYGSGVVGGLIQLETKNASDFTGGEPGLKFRQTLGGQSNGEGWVSSSILAWQPTENVEFLANYTWRDVGNYTDGAGNEVENSAYELPSWLIKGRVSFGDANAHALTLSLSDTTTAERDVPYDAFGLTGGSFGNVDRDIETTIAALTYEFDPPDNDLVNIAAILSYSRQKIDSSYVAGSSPLEPYYPSISALGDADQDYETTKLTLKNTAVFDTGIASHELRAGIEWSKSERLDAYSAPGGTDERLAFFAVDEIAIGDRLTLTPAVRYEAQTLTGTDTVADGEVVPYDGEVDNSGWMGGLSAFYRVAGGFSVFGSAAYTLVLPPIDDLNNLALANTSEQARTYEIGFSYAGQDLLAAGDVFRAKVNAYRTHMWDVTSYVWTDPATLVSTPLDHVDVEGVEIEASYALASGWYADFNGTVISGTETWSNGDEDDWRNIPGDSLSLAIGKRFDDWLDLNWELVAAASAPKLSGEGDAPGWSVHNIRATWTPQQGPLDGFEVYAAVENVLDREYTPNLSTLPAMGRNFKLTIAKTF